MKVIVDTSIWINHLRVSDPDLQKRLEDQEVYTHPAILLELSLGQIRNRKEFLGFLNLLPSASAASFTEGMQVAEEKKLYGLGLSAIDALILASAKLSDAAIMTRDKGMLKAMALLRITKV